MSEESQSRSKYRFDKILGEGSSGTVYLGFDEHNQKVVIKKFKNSVLDIANSLSLPFAEVNDYLRRLEKEKLVEEI